jgi:hypothetical protein
VTPREILDLMNEIQHGVSICPFKTDCIYCDRDRKVVRLLSELLALRGITIEEVKGERRAA